MRKKHSIVTFPSSRQFTMDVGKLGMEKHHIKALIELDVTDSRKMLKKLRSETGRKISFTSWILKCISQAISEHKQVQALRKGRGKLVIFDDVDISMAVEKVIDGVSAPIPMVMREVNKKSMDDIFREIETAKEREVKNADDYVLGDKKSKEPIGLFAMVPQFLRLIIWKIMMSNPYWVRKTMGTVMVSSVGMMGKIRGWFIPRAIHSICFGLGSIIKKPGVIRNEIQPREYLQMTILIDHDVVDGAPAARFVSYLTKLVEEGYGL